MNISLSDMIRLSPESQEILFKHVQPSWQLSGGMLKDLCKGHGLDYETEVLNIYENMRYFDASLDKESVEQALFGGTSDIKLDGSAEFKMLMMTPSKSGITWRNEAIRSIPENIDAFSLAKALENENYGYLYVLRTTEAGGLKVGFSSKPVKRKSSLKTGNHEKLHHVFVCKSHIKLESLIKSKIKCERYNGEWFSPSIHSLSLLKGVSMASGNLVS